MSQFHHESLVTLRPRYFLSQRPDQRGADVITPYSENEHQRNVKLLLEHKATNMIHSAPWKLGVVTLITGGKSGREVGVATPVLVTQRRGRRLHWKDAKSRPRESSEGYSFRFSSWHVFQITHNVN